MSIKLNDRFLAVRDQYFAFEQSFDMGNGTTFTHLEAHRCPHPGGSGVLSERLY